LEEDDATYTCILHSFYHKNFINAEVCCNPDPVVFQETSDVSAAAVAGLWAGVGPRCRIQMM
jgi:hypothetical protein